MEMIHFRISGTPNPHSLKYIFEKMIKTEGKSFYSKAEDCGENVFAKGLFSISGISQIAIFGNSITISKEMDREWDELYDVLSQYFQEHLPSHDANYRDINPEEERRAVLPEILKQIEEILDRTVRPYIQNDGGDLECISFEKNILTINYVGSCGTCPSSTTGTLASIQSTLRAELGIDDLQVVAGNSPASPYYSPYQDDPYDHHHEDETYDSSSKEKGESNSEELTKNDFENVADEDSMNPKSRSIKDRLERIKKLFSQSNTNNGDNNK